MSALFNFVFLSALFAVAYGGYASTYGHGGYGHGHGHHHHNHGYANVNVWQTPYAYQYGLNEHGGGYNKFIWQGADFHNSHPVKVHHGYGHGH